MKLKINSMAFFCLMIAVLITISNCRQENRSYDCPHSKFEDGIYYSQTYEDYILAYVFKNVANGFYIDVGANDPNVFNVTRFFYERGWRGINIEPNVELFKRIVQFRPRDRNYNCGISNTEGNLKFYQETNEFDDLMPMSTFDKAIAERQKKEHRIHFTEILVPVKTLNNLLAKISIPEITFITIDVEGFEKQVIESIDLTRYKPVVLCIEAMDPSTENPSYRDWEKLVIDNNYVFAMSDGLNRYYLHKSHIELLPRFIDIDRCVKLSKYKRQVKMDGWSLW
jgi:FkbM family methyltransferase